MPNVAFGSPIRREEAGFGQATERPQQACQLPREEAGLGQATERPQQACQLARPRTGLWKCLEGFC